MDRRRLKEKAFIWLTRTVTWCSIVILVVLLSHIVSEGYQWLSKEFLTNFPSRRPSRAGIKAAILGSVWLMLLTAFFSVPFGVATAVFFEEYAPKNKRWVRTLQLNIANLAGMPSIIYGLLGLALFVRFFGFGRSVLSGALTLSLLILPIIVIASQEAIRAVPNSIRYAAYGLGARRWQVILGQVIPAALPGILTGVILAPSRAIGESAPLIMIGAATYINFVPESMNDEFTALPLQIFSWASRPNEDFHSLAAAAIIVLLVVLFTLNLGAVLIRQRFQRYKL